MRVIAASDLHGHLPRPSEMPPGDLFLIAGDVCPVEDHSINRQRRWLENDFASWLGELPYRPERICWIAGNHDYALELGSPGRRLRRAATYLQDSASAIDIDERSYKVWGSPWSETIGPWAFSLPETTAPRARDVSLGAREMIAPGAGPAPPRYLRLELAWQLIPDDADIVLVHSPPYGRGDGTIDGYRLGSPSLLRRLRAIGPRLVVCGHVHEGHGRWQMRWGPNETLGTIVNAALLDHAYRPSWPPQVIELGSSG